MSTSFTEPRRRRALVSIALFLGIAALAVAFRGPLVSWFTGKPMTAGDPAEPEHGTTAAPAGLRCAELPKDAEEPLRTAFASYEQVRELLAGDSLDGLEPRAERLQGALASAGRQAEGDLHHHLSEASEAAGRMTRAASLEEARSSFARVSRVLTGIAACEPQLAQGWHLFECSMTSGYNRWMQRSDKAENPYQGKAMLTCGSPEQWSAAAPAGAAGSGQADISHWTCPMHPSVRQAGPGQCPICGMDLVPVRRAEKGFGEIVLGQVPRELGGIRTGVVELRPVEAEVHAVGRVAFDETRFEDVTVKYSGYIGRLYAEETGRPVRRGQTLFTLYSPELYAAQREYLVALESQRAAQATSAPDRADYLVRAARQKLHLWDLSDAQIRQVEQTGKPVEQIAVPSPASGYIVEKDVVEGAAVQPGMRLFRLAGLDRVWVEAEVYEAELSKVRTGQPARVTLSHLPGEALRGHVSLVYPVLNPESRTARVRIEVRNRNGAAGPVLKPEMYADVVLESAQREALMVPESAVVYTGPRRLVFVDVGGGRYQPREVRLGAKSGDHFEVVAGLQAGDVVVTSGNFLLDAETRLQSGGEADHDHGR